MCFTDLVGENAVDVFILPAECRSGLFPGGDGEIDTGDEQGFGIGLHTRAVIAVFLCFDTTGAEFVAGGIGLKVTAEQTMPSLTEFTVTEENGSGATANRQGSKVVFNGFAG